MSSSINETRLLDLWNLLEHWNHKSGVRAIAAETGNEHNVVGNYYVGYDDSERLRPVDDQSRFLIASPTKPFIAVAAMILVEKGLLQISDRVSKYLPSFGGQEKAGIRIANLLTHTSGLPDMLPNDLDLRKNKAPLSEYQRHTNAVELIHKPGTRVHYQSMGILTLSSILEVITTVSTPEFLDAEIFSPLQMTNTSLGVTDDCLRSTRPPVDSMVEHLEGHDDWGWNSNYWRKLGAPWGGLISTSSDIGLFCRHLLTILAGQGGILSSSTLRAMASNQLSSFPQLRSGTCESVPWGYGWQLNWPNHPRGFGSILPKSAFGHWGATGTLVWIDPSKSVYGVILTNEPLGAEDRRQIKFANLCRLAWD